MHLRVRSGHLFRRKLPAKHQEVMAAERASAGLKKPRESSLDNTLGPNASKRDGFAVRTTAPEQHAWYGDMVYTDPAGVTSPVDSGLASRAALCLLGVLKSGLEDLAQFRALEEWRLWRFKSLLAVSRLSIGNLERPVGEKAIPEAGLIQLGEVGPGYFSLTIIREAKSHVKP